MDLMARVIRLTPAADDCDHIRLIVDNNPKVPSRIKAIIEGTGPSPAPCLIDMAKRLVAHGAEILAIPCNTAHYYRGEVAKAVSVPLLDMIGISVERILGDNPGIRKVGILASPAVIMTGLYNDRFKEKAVELIAPEDGPQTEVFESICSVKAGDKDGEVKQRPGRAAAALVDAGAEAILVACTELSILCDGMTCGVPVYDSAELLAEQIVRAARE